MNNSWIPPNDSVVWVFGRQVVLLVVFMLFGLFAYQNHMSMADFTLIVTMMASILGIDVFKRTNAPRE